eukprot:1161596-Pelagomonas_calceolata.AAC.7
MEGKQYHLESQGSYESSVCIGHMSVAFLTGEEGGPCWDVGEHAWGLGVGLKLAGQGLPDSRVVGPMVVANLLE